MSPIVRLAACAAHAALVMSVTLEVLAAALDPAFGSDGLVILDSEEVDPLYNPTPRPLLEPEARPLYLERLTDGAVLIGSARTLRRVSPRGDVDAAFGYGALGIAGGCVAPNRCNTHFGRVLLRGDGTMLVPLVASTSWEIVGPGVFGVVKLKANGRLDPSFGQGGVALLAPVPGVDDIRAVGALEDAQGRIVVVGSSGDRSVAEGFRWTIARFLASGVPDLSIGAGGRKSLGMGLDSSPAFTVVESGGFALGGLERNGPRLVARVARFDEEGGVDAAFTPYTIESGGLAEGYPIVRAPSALASDADGTLLAVAQFEGFLSHVGYEGPVYAARMVRVAADGSKAWALPVDQPRNPTRFSIGELVPGSVVLGPEGKPYLVTVDSASIVARFDANDLPDSTFAATGSRALPLYDPRAIVVEPDGRMLVAGYEYASEYEGAELVATQRREVLIAVRHGEGLRRVVVNEFRHHANPYYFYSGFVDEVTALKQEAAWLQTGKSFVGYAEPSQGLIPVCRFFSGPAQAAGYAHFFTADAAQCATLSPPNPIWSFEGIAFYMRPVEQTASGQPGCSEGLRLLFMSQNLLGPIANRALYHDDGSTIPRPPGWGGSPREPFGCVPTE